MYCKLLEVTAHNPLLQYNSLEYRTTSNIRTCFYLIKPQKDVASTANRRQCAIYAIRVCAFIIK